MLQRAASNAYSWWWASHIRTKQSKWLEENLQDMDEKINNMLKIIENDGDSFAQRAEMYYRKRPELIGHVEDSYRAYRALAERYDHLSKDMQRANRTIAAVFPEQVQYAEDYDDDYEREDLATSFSDDPNKKYDLSKANIPKVPSTLNKEFRSCSTLLSKKEQLNRTASIAKANAPPGSGLRREEAIEEIDKIQKDILALQTEREFIESIREQCNAKCSGIENQITDMQARVSSLQDEFGIGNVIDDNEARTLMAATALKSCQETLVKLQEKQEKSTGEVEVENQRVKDMIKKFTALQGDFHSNQTGLQVPTDEQETDSENVNQPDTEIFRETLNEKLEAESKSSLTVMQLAGRIDELVETIVHLETAVSSQDALVNILKAGTDGLQERIKTLEEEKEILMDNSENMSNKLMELEEELHRVKRINQNAKYQNDNLQAHFTEASCSIDQLSEKLQTVKRDEEAENADMIQEMEAAADVEAGKGIEANGEQEEKKDDMLTENHLVLAKEEKDEKKDLLDMDANLDNQLEELRIDEDENQPNWKHLFTGGLEEREKFLVEEYTLVLRNYKEVRKRLGEVEKKNRDGFFELALQIRELKNAIAIRDEEIQSLRKVSSPRENEDENHDTNSIKYSLPEGSPESIRVAPSIPDSNQSTLSSPQQPIMCSADEDHVESRERIDGLADLGGIKRSTGKKVSELKHFDKHCAASAIEEKFRLDIDGLLEENLEFWLRFSNSFHQIQKFQTSVQDLKAEIINLKNKSQDEGNKNRSQALMSEVRAIYRHLKEIQTELTIWLETNSVLKDELQDRCTSLCNIQEEISRISSKPSKAEEPELSEWQAAKFQGEILNMKQENNKVADQLQAGMDRANGLKEEVEKTLSKMDEEFGLAASKQRTFRSRIPLRLFLFGAKLKRQRGKSSSSLFACGSPGLHKIQYDTADAPIRQ